MGFAPFAGPSDGVHPVIDREALHAAENRLVFAVTGTSA